MTRKITIVYTYFRYPELFHIKFRVTTATTGIDCIPSIISGAYSQQIEKKSFKQSSNKKIMKIQDIYILESASALLSLKYRHHT